MKPYMIRDWKLHYENNRSKELKVMTWVPVPVKLSGDGYTQIMAEADGPALFGMWIALVELAAMSQQRGTLMRGDGRPHDAASISRITRIPLALIERGLFFFDEVLDWIDSGDHHAAIPQASRIEPAGIPQDDAAQPAAIPALKEGDKEVINKEEEREGEAAAPPALPPRAAKAVKEAGFRPPTDLDLLTHCKELNLDLDGWMPEIRKFKSYYAATGWKSKDGAPITDWQAAFDLWRRRAFDYADAQKARARRRS